MTQLTNHHLGRRQFLVTTGSILAASPEANAMSMFVATVLPTFLASIMSLLGIRWQLDQEAERNRQEMSLSVANLRIAQAQLMQQVGNQKQQDRMNALQLLLSHSEEARRRFETTNLHLVESAAFDSVNGTYSNRALLENADGAGSRIGTVQGRLVVERAGTGSYLDNQFAYDLGAHSLAEGDPLPVAVTGLIRDMDRKLSQHLIASAAEAWREDDQDIREQYALAGYRSYSRARRPQGKSDLQAVLFHPKQSGGAIRYAYV